MKETWGIIMDNGSRSKRPEGLIRGIQFDKHIFRNVPREYQERFWKTFGSRLAKLEDIFRGTRRAAGNDIKLVAGRRGRRVFKRRIGDHRLSMVLNGGILTLLKISRHDRQMVDIRNITGKSIGYVYYDVGDFLRRMTSWQDIQREGTISFGEYLANPGHFVFDEAQRSVMESGESMENLSVIGNAGAGKSVVGLKWIHDQASGGKRRCLYLTMSENLVYTLSFELKKSFANEGAAGLTDIRTTFDFLKSRLMKSYPRLPERSLLNAAQSMAVFRRFWREEVDWTRFWNHNDPAFSQQSNETTLLAAWREIHGIIKGTVPIDIDFGRLDGIPEYLSEEEYQERLRDEKKDSVKDILWVKNLYGTYEKYQTYLRRRLLFDDNDIARMILKVPPTKEKGKVYEAVFVDECQDLTQMELLAIFHLLGDVKASRMASDRCQMVQPTYFHEGWMRTVANSYARYRGRALEENSIRPHYLHYNYRSGRSVIDFQNYVVQYFRTSDILSLKQSEIEEIQVPPLAARGMRPVWICPGADNQRRLIEELWRKTDSGELQAIFAFRESEGKKDFRLREGDAVTDVIDCKGMEYPSVLLYDILSELRFNPVMAWKYFYVGATRGNGCLIIYEKEALPGTRIYSFLAEAADKGLLDRCDELEGQRPGGSQTWLEYLRLSIREDIGENPLEIAENALNFGQYELAFNIYSHDGRDSNMAAYCRGKLLESRNDFPSALESYARISADWSNRGRNRANSVEGLLKNPDIEGEEFLGAYFLSEQGRENLIPGARSAWRRKFGNDRGFYEALGDMLELYSFTGSYFSDWTDVMIGKIGGASKRVGASVAEGPFFRQQS
ncbi:MAG: hypothetical protein IKR28_03045 [Selenomonadaceae bacterium]|nr:hypothetical protein [Selenomonadaceae bacterium]